MKIFFPDEPADYGNAHLTIVHPILILMMISVKGGMDVRMGMRGWEDVINIKKLYK